MKFRELIRTICLICLVPAVMAATAQAAKITFVGSHEGIQGAFRTTTVDKPMDADFDNVYGTDGYLFFNMASPGAGGAQVDYAINMKESVPGYFSSETVIPGEDAISGNYSGFPDIDDPTQTPGPDVPDISPGYGGYAPVGGGGNAPEQTIFSYVIGEVPPSTFRVGIYTDFYTDIRITPNLIGLQIGATKATVDPSTVSTDGDGDMYFFDVVGAREGDILEFRAANTITTHSRNFAIVVGVTFDTVSDPEKASNPIPADGATDVPWDVVLSWEPGDYADKHDVYLGTDFDDVNDADRTTPLDVLVSQNQVPDSYSPAEVLQFSQTYYWRIDEVNAPPDYTLYEGRVWQFTVEPIAYPIAGERITVTASSQSENQGPENTVNGSGLDADGLHSIEATDMWLSGSEPNGAWIEFEFDKVCKLHQMWVWNHNTLYELVIGYGIKEATIEYSADGANWTTLGTTHEFVQAPGADGYEHNTTVDFGGAPAKYVRLTANSNWGGMTKQYGLSEVRFFSIPVFAREPSPDSGATDVDVDVILGFRAGREAAEHNVYLSSDEQAVIDGNAPVTTVTETSYGPLSLDLGTTYYWKINEVNDAETTTTWQGEIWNFSTPEFFVVDDFESYNEIPAGEEGSNLVYLTWIDGYDNPSVNGSTMGHTVAFEPSMESVTVYDGKQSAPLYYDNSTAGYSEATANVADLQIGQDWTKHGIKALTLRFSGDPNNAVQQMYVKLNGSKVTYDGDAENIRRTVWQMWYIDLASLGVSLTNVTELSIGFERSGAVGGQGVVYFDGIRLYPHDRQLITPVEPNTAGLVGHWPLDGNPNNISANGYDGVAEGGVTYGEGVLGQAADFNGSDALIDCGDVPVGDTGAISIACWVKPRNIAQDWAGYVSKWTVDNSQRTFWLGQHSTDGWLRSSIYPGGPTAETSIDSGQVILANEQWTHIVCTYDGDFQRIYAEGVEVVSSPERNAAIVDRGGNLRFGIVSTANWFNGLIDDVRIYDRVLSSEEIAWLGGRTMPFDKPF